MTTVLLIVHLFVTLALIGLVLIQRSEGGGLGIGTSQGMGSFMSGRGTANLLTRGTSILGAVFFALSLTLAILNRGTTGVGHSILDVPPPVTAPGQTTAPTTTPTPAVPAPAAPGTPAAPAAGAAPAVPAPDAAPAAPKGPAVPTN